MSVRAVIYCRISEDQQDGWGVGDQEEHCRRLADVMEWEVVGVYVDNDLGATARTRKPRRDYERLKRAIAAGLVEAELIREATKRLLRGETLGGICADWQSRGITTPTGGPWRQTTLRQTLMRPALIGYRDHPVAGRVRGTWPPILSEDEWERLQAFFSDPDRQNHGRVNVRSYLLTGFIYCGRCCKPLRGGPRQGGERTYTCRKDVGFQGCGRLRRKADLVEEEVVERLMHRLDSEALRASLVAVDDDADAADRKEIAWCKARLTRLADDYADDVLTKPEYLRQKARIMERKEAAERRRGSRQAT